MIRRQQQLMIAAALALALVAGCKTVRYETVPPTTDAGRACITQCAAIKESCHANELRRVRLERDDCERRSDLAVRRCRAEVEDADKRAKCESVRSSCWVSEDKERCESSYRSCFAQCGGTVRKIVEDR